MSLWQLTDRGDSVPIGHDRLCSELEALCPSAPGQQTLNMLRCEDLVEVNCQGDYLLTSRGLRMRRSLPTVMRPEPATPKRTGHEWDRFRKILSYYIDCVRLQEHPQEYLFSDDLNRKYFIPILPPGWLKAPGTKSRQRVRVSRAQLPAMRRLLTRRDDDEEIYLGYPVSIFQPKSHPGNCCSPIGLIPVDIVDSSQTMLEIELRLDEAEINQQYLDYNFSHDRRNDVLNTILRLHERDEFRGVIDLQQALPFLETGGAQFDPDNLELVLPVVKEGSRGKPCNAAVLFVGQSLRYSKTLTRELRYIRDKVSDETLDSTALAYIFREPVLKGVEPERRLMPLPFINSNPEQMAAVGAALNDPSVKVTGPPGTGKSQVAVNIIANLIYRDQTVLFTSRNHKAVEAISSRSHQVLPESGLALVNFCTSEFPNPWYKQDLDTLIAGAGADTFHNDGDELMRISATMDRWRHIEELHAERNKILAQYEQWLRKNDSLRKQLEYLLGSPAASALTDKEFRILRRHIGRLADQPHFSWRELWKWLRWKAGGAAKDTAARQYLREQFPGVLDSAISLAELRERFDKFSGIYKDFCELKKSGDNMEGLARKLPPQNQGTAQLKEVFREINSVLHRALIIRRCQKIAELESDPELVNRLKNIMTFMTSANSPAFFQRLETREAQEAETGFKIFSRYYPGWAVSLLSLTKASPCINGLFDRVIIDEASQCDPASIIPALFRAKGVVLIGDSNQFPPVVDMKPLRNDFIKTRDHVTEVEDQRFDFMNTAAFDLSPAAPIMLKEHFRCAEEIAEYFNDAFYAGELHIRTDSARLKRPEFMGYRHAVEWIDVHNSNPGELDAVRTALAKLLDNNYSGSIGVITPFKKYAETLKEQLYPRLRSHGSNGDDDKVRISTANGFQGGECDVIIFMLGYNDELSRGMLWYAESPENRYIYNVAVSRARACLIVVGDRERCRQSNVSVLNKLAQMPRPQKPRDPEHLFESPWEKRLYDALIEEGIETQPQYPLVGRRLDLALIRGDVKIDIEIDGIHYHTDNDGNRKLDDNLRDLQVESAGWLVKRFWVYELRDNMPECVREIKSMLS